MSYSNNLPSILVFPNSKQSSIAMNRALKQIRKCLLEFSPEGEIPDHLQASIDDCDLMIGAVENE